MSFINARTARRAAAAAFTLFASFLFLAKPAWAAGEVHLAIVVGNNGSATLARAELRYADDDAAKYAALLGGVGQSGDVELLTRMDGDTSRLFPTQERTTTPPTRASLEAAASRIAERAKAAEKRGERVVFTFVFAGHGDVEDGRGFLELEDGRFFREDLEALLVRIPAARAHVILDACNSVYMLASRKPGGTMFATPADVERSMRARLAHVGTFLSTSADAQVYEWSQIESGVFSHAVRSGLAGAADLDGDGRITYGELRSFVRIAAAGVPNARFRPRIYARGPGGHDDEVVFEPRAAGAGRKFSLGIGRERRITVLDGNEVPVVDARLEAGFAPSLYLPPSEGGFTLVEREEARPERRTEVALTEAPVLAQAFSKPPEQAPRAAARPFELLFSVGFGPRAVAALPPEKPEEEVYGVSADDRDRMGWLLDTAAGMQRGRRLQTALLLGVTGVIWAGGGAAMLATRAAPGDDQRAQNVVGGVFLGAGALGIGFGALRFLQTTDLEDRQAAYHAAVRGRTEDLDVAVRDAERELFARADSARKMRNVLAVGTLTLGAVALGASVTLEAIDPSVESRTPRRLGMAIGAGYMLLGAGLLALPISSEEERLADLWRKERPAVAPAPRSHLQVKPVFGAGTLGVMGTF